MKKYIIGIAVIMSFVLGFYSYQLEKAVNNFGGVESTNLNYYKTATNTSVVCNGATSTLILAEASSQGSRMAFSLTVASSTGITFCQSASGCVQGSGLLVSGSGGSVEIDDAYYGAYSCIGNGSASSTIGIIYKQ